LQPIAELFGSHLKALVVVTHNLAMLALNAMGQPLVEASWDRTAIRASAPIFIACALAAFDCSAHV